MRHILIASIIIASSASLASADPIAVHTTIDEPSALSPYVAAGMMGGLNHGDLVAAGTLEVGLRVSSFAAVHGVFVGGDTGRFFQQVSGHIVQARAGADLFTCNPGDMLCAFVGVDVGVQHTHDAGPGCASFEQCYMSERVDERDTSAIAVPRMGLEVGNRHLRARVELDATLAHGGADGADAITSLVYRF